MIRPSRPVYDRIMEKVSPEPNSGCWLWTASLDSHGYGQIMTPDQKPKRAHRVLYQCVKGDVAANLDLDHLCRNRGCVNPDHLEPVTRSVNLRRGIGPRKTKERFAQKTGCMNGHKYEAGSYIVYFHVKRKRSYRICKVCASTAQVAYKARRVA